LWGRARKLQNNFSLRFIIILISLLCTLSVVLAQGQSNEETPQQYVIFDEIGHMAAGMANIHVAIPVNLTTFKRQASVLSEYLRKLTKVVDDGKEHKEIFMQTIRELAKFAEVRLAHIRKRIDHLDIILPFDGDLTEGQRHRRSALMTDIQEDEIIETDRWTDHTIDKIINLDDIILEPLQLKEHFTARLHERIRQVTHINRTFSISHRRHRIRRHRNKRAATCWLRPEYCGDKERKSILALQKQKLQLQQILLDIYNETAIIEEGVATIIRQQETIRNTPQTFNIFEQISDSLKQFFPDKIFQRQQRQKRQVRTNRDDHTYYGYVHELNEERSELQAEIFQLLINITLANKYQERIKFEYFARVSAHQKKASRGEQEFFTLDEIFRPVPSATDHGRDKRFAPLVAVAAITGTLGTFLGIYTAIEIGILKHKFNTMSRNHNLLVHVTKRHEEQISRLTENMNAICSLIKLMIQFNPSLISAQLEAQLQLFEWRLAKVFNVVQQLQHRRLAVDYMDTFQLTEMHKAITDIAEKRGYTLLPERLSDYFQLEASYLRQGDDILIILHVPCIVHDQLLTLYKYIPFPYPIPQRIHSEQKTIKQLLLLSQISHISNITYAPQAIDQATVDALIMIPEADLIAVGKGRRYKVLTHSDLAACNQRNKVYLCEQHQVLHTELANSCLGSIFDRNEQGVRDNCKVERKTLRETIYQISSTDHLLFTPIPYTTQIECKNGSQFPLYLAQTTKFHVPEDCRVSLQSFSIQSDYNIRISPEPLNVPWQWDPLSLPANLLLDAAIIDDKISEIDNSLRKLLQDTSHKTHFEEMLNSSFSEPANYPWFIWVSVLFTVLGLLLLIFWYCYNHCQAKRATQQQQQPMQPISFQMYAATAPTSTHPGRAPPNSQPQSPTNPEQRNLYPNADSID